uniref:Uncharacterized protein n=1 Tax=Chelonoidis abingdonii TaxID=106734 RepID=A0A8C0G9M6_CHEAB
PGAALPALSPLPTSGTSPPPRGPARPRTPLTTRARRANTMKPVRGPLPGRRRPPGPRRQPPRESLRNPPEQHQDMTLEQGARHFLPKAAGDTPLPVSPQKAAYTLVLQDWLQLSCHREAAPEAVGERLAAYRALSPRLLEFILNMADGNGNTALHYSVSHSNFPMVQRLLETGEGSRRGGPVWGGGS